MAAFSSYFVQTTIAQNAVVSKHCPPRTSDNLICAFRKHAGVGRSLPFLAFSCHKNLFVLPCLPCGPSVVAPQPESLIRHTAYVSQHYCALWMDYCSLCISSNTKQKNPQTRNDLLRTTTPVY